MPEPGSQPAIRTVVVLAMHRSGTSLIAGMLHRLGVVMGGREDPANDAWVGKHWSNPVGHFEDPAFITLDRRILHLDASHRVYLTPQCFAPDAEESTWSPEIERLVRRSESTLWGWKSAFAPLTIDLYLPHVRHPYLVFVHRDPAEVADSLQRRDRTERAESERVVSVYGARLRGLEDRHHDLPQLHLEYDAVQRNPATVVAQLEVFLSLPADPVREASASSLALGPKDLKVAARAEARRDLWAFPRWAGWYVKRELREDPRQLSRRLWDSVGLELYQTFRVAVTNVPTAAPAGTSPPGS